MAEKIIYFLNDTFPLSDIGKMIQIKKENKSTLFNNNEKNKHNHLCFGLYLNIAKLCRDKNSADDHVLN